MGVNEIKQEISKIEGSIELERQKLDELRQRIIEEAKPFIKAQLKENVEREVKSNSEHTMELGRERLAEMKQQLKALLDSSDNLVEDMFSDDSLWIYVNYDIGDDRYAYSNQKTAGEKIHKAIKTMLGEAGRLLVDNGYIKVGSMYQWDGGTYGSFNLTSSRPVKSKLVYKGYLPMPELLGRLIGEYTKKIENFHELYVKVSDLRKRLSEQEAADLWDEV